MRDSQSPSSPSSMSPDDAFSADWREPSSRVPPQVTPLGDKPAGARFHIEQLDLQFSNGERRIYERLKNRGHGAVMVVPMHEHGSALMVREYAAGTERYELGLVKGRIDAGESPEQATLRELQEEIGFGARSLEKIKQLSIVPGYMSHQMHVFVAWDLYPSKLPGDEPEPLDIVPVPLHELQDVVFESHCSDGRCIAALLMAQQWWCERFNHDR